MDVYRRSLDSSLNEQLPGETHPALSMQDWWQPEDGFHIDSCTRRHEKCRTAARKVRLDALLALDLLRSCSQIYDEARTMPFMTYVFGFPDAARMKAFHGFLNETQTALIRGHLVLMDH